MNSHRSSNIYKILHNDNLPAAHSCYHNMQQSRLVLLVYTINIANVNFFLCFDLALEIIHLKSNNGTLLDKVAFILDWHSPGPSVADWRLITLFLIFSRSVCILEGNLEWLAFSGNLVLLFRKLLFTLFLVLRVHSFWSYN